MFSYELYNKHFNLEHLYKISEVLEIEISEFFTIDI